ncbi:hypothetical protein LTR36_010533 [Oleoguttula mirabilis]|uniref:Uncharacterized protein n=1 Tax=Oleoguttula mirabilis TaxID=1507867 RepID=A0AAV9J4G1_9PEZI|nr:hypothetical protein LTR36_010533 [Oleoguttula mirabilis]
MASKKKRSQRRPRQDEDPQIIRERQRESKARRRSNIKQRKRDVARNEKAAQRLLAPTQQTAPNGTQTSLPASHSTPTRDDASTEPPPASVDTESAPAALPSHDHALPHVSTPPPSVPSTTTSVSTQTQTEVCTQLGTLYYIPSHEYHADRAETAHYKAGVEALTAQLQELEKHVAGFQEENLQLHIRFDHMQAAQGSSAVPHAHVHVNFYEGQLAEAWRLGRKLYPRAAECGDWGDAGVPAEDTAAWLGRLRREVTHAAGIEAWRRIEAHAAEMDEYESGKRSVSVSVEPEWSDAREVDAREVDDAEMEGEVGNEIEIEDRFENEAGIEIEDEIEDEWPAQGLRPIGVSRPHLRISRRGWIEQGMGRPLRT